MIKYILPLIKDSFWGDHAPDMNGNGTGEGYDGMYWYADELGDGFGDFYYIKYHRCSGYFFSADNNRSNFNF